MSRSAGREAFLLAACGSRWAFCKAFKIKLHFPEAARENGVHSSGERARAAFGTDIFSYNRDFLQPQLR